jgi:glycosyltransferase involved in cell wall biosynthesis
MFDYPWGGSEELWVQTANAILDDGHELVVSVFKWEPLAPKIARLKERGAYLHLRERVSVNSISDRIKRKLNLYQDHSFRDFFLQKPDVILVNNGATYDFIKYPALVSGLQTASIPFYFISQFNADWGLVLRDNLTTARGFYLKARKSFFVSERNLQTAQTQMVAHLQNASVVRNPVNLANRDVVPYPSGETIQFASVARLDSDFKGQHILLETLGEPAWQNRNWHLNFFGKGPDEVYLKELAHFYNIGEKVTFHNHVSDIRKVWQENHLLVMPSIGEGTPLSLVEAMLCGRTAVVTDVGGNAEWINKETGFIAEAPLKKYFSAAMEAAWQQHNRWQDMGLIAREQALQKIDTSPGNTVWNKMKAD